MPKFPLPSLTPAYPIHIKSECGLPSLFLALQIQQPGKQTLFHAINARGTFWKPGSSS